MRCTMALATPATRYVQAYRRGAWRNIARSALRKWEIFRLLEGALPPGVHLGPWRALSDPRPLGPDLRWLEIDVIDTRSPDSVDPRVEHLPGRDLRVIDSRYDGPED